MEDTNIIKEKLQQEALDKFIEYYYKKKENRGICCACCGYGKSYLIYKIIKECIEISKEEWNTRETSLWFLQNELFRFKRDNLKESCELFQQYWEKKFFQMQKFEEELNQIYINRYEII
jgi:hypothetical protein